MRLFMLMLLAGVCAAQELPDAPSAVPAWGVAPPVKCGPKWLGGCFRGRPQLTWAEAAKSKKFWIPTAIVFGAIVFDVEATHQGIAHGVCIEGNDDLPAYPSRGELYRNALYTKGVIIGMGYVFTKLKVPWPVYAGMATYSVQSNIRGGVGWLRECW
jgi:hypothetical protein